MAIQGPGIRKATMEDSQTQERLLVVVGSSNQAEELKHTLMEHGYAVEVARDGVEAWARIRTARPDLVISDIDMPEMNGFELCGKIRAEAGLEDLPVILLRAHTNLEDVLQGLASGADNFITKPYNEVRLLTSIRAQLAQRQDLKLNRKKDPVITYGGQDYLIKAGAEKILAFFLSTYAFALDQKAELTRTQVEMQQLKESLEKIGRERAQALVAESSQRQETEEELARARQHQEMILNSVGEGILGLDRERRITFANPAAARMLGYEPEEMVGRSSDMVCLFSQPDGRPFPETECPFHATLQDGKVRGLEGVFWRHDDTCFPAEGNSTAITEDGQISGAVITFWDISERRRTEEALRRAFEGAVKALAQTVEARDPYTAGHQLRTTDLAWAIAYEMNLSQDRLETLRIASSLHDIGKIKIPAEILSKPTRLTSTEFQLIKMHPTVGYEIVKAVEFPGEVAEIIAQHHERLDGSGYPLGLKGEEILPEARILAIADVVEAMVSHRPYRPGLGIDQALEEIARNRGVLYDPQVVDVCLRLFSENKFSFDGVSSWEIPLWQTTSKGRLNAEPDSW
jgi:PAS domain S-box-containing protein/putative nucleotidyltransferase with HDIG domain